LGRQHQWSIVAGETIATPLDWLGVNHYSPGVIAGDQADGLLCARETGAPRTMLEWEVRAEGREQGRWADRVRAR